MFSKNSAPPPELMQLYSERKSLTDESNLIVTKILNLQDQENDLSQQLTGSHANHEQLNLQLNQCKEEKARLLKCYKESKLEDKIEAVRKKMSTKEIEIYGKEKLSSPSTDIGILSNRFGK
jgi:chromosome segregation ATPase